MTSHNNVHTHPVTPYQLTVDGMSMAAIHTHKSS